MKIVQQTSDNECGVCVINMLANYYHNKTIDKNIILQKANLTKNGLSLQELENLANEFNLDAQSFKCSFEELIDEKINDYFIALINKNGLNHFVIVKNYNKNFFRIYDPENKIYELNNEEFKKIFLNIIVRVSKNHQIFDLPIFKESYLKNIKLSSLIIILFIELLNIPLNIFLSKIVNLLGELSSIQIHLNNIIHFLLVSRIKLLVNTLFAICIICLLGLQN